MIILNKFDHIHEQIRPNNVINQWIQELVGKIGG
jgi:hypothetical protein